jgi:hypothetical protein
MRPQWLGIGSLLLVAITALLLTVTPLAVAAEADPWTLVGSALTGGADGGLALSGNGTIAAVGTPGDDTVATNAGVVRVYAQGSGGWSQFGDSIFGSMAKDAAGTSIALSDDGLVLAIGAPGTTYDMMDGVLSKGWVQVFEWNGTVWRQRGRTLFGVNNHDRFGFSVSLSDDGSVLAVGSPQRDVGGTDTGRTTIYTWASSSWSWSQSAAIDGLAASDRSGFSVSLNGDGTRVAMGAAYALGSGTGQVRVFGESLGSWERVGNVINGVAWANFGWSVSLSDDGATLAVGAPWDATSDGNTFVYVLSGTTWTQLGSTIPGERDNDVSGKSVALSGDGLVLAIGADENDDNGTGSGNARVFRWNGTSWERRGGDIDGSAGSNSGRAVALNDNGRRIAVSSPIPMSSVGDVRIYGHSGSDGPPPTAPLVVSGAADSMSVTVSSTSVVLTWLAPVSNGGATIIGYTATASTGETCSVTSVAPATPDRTCTISGLPNGASYTFTVTATNAVGPSAASIASAVVMTPRTVPGQPTGVSGTPGNRSVVVSWTAPASNGGATIIGYTATASTGETCAVASVAPATPATSCTFSGLTNGTAYTFTVTAANAVGTGAASVASGAVSPSAPAATVAPTVPATPVASGGGGASATPSAAPPAAVTQATAAATRSGGNVTLAVALPTTSIGAKVVIMRKVGKRYVAISTTKATSSALNIRLKVKGKPGSTHLRVVVGGKIVKSLKV